MSRLFLAIPVQLYHYEAIKEQFTTLAEGRWAEEVSLHLTVAFLGQRFEPDEVIGTLSSFDFTFGLSNLNGFDYFDQSRVLIATTQNETLHVLHQQLIDLLGIDDGRFIPHVTLMRVKKIPDPTLFSSSLNRPHPDPVGRLLPKAILYQSILQSGGSHYIPLHEWDRKENKPAVP